MSDPNVHPADEAARTRIYDRAFLLSPEKHNQEMALWEVRRYGLDNFGNGDYTNLYGMAPEEWYKRGIRVCARTTVECVRDTVADRIGRDVALILKHAPTVAGFTVFDPFAGSCNSLYWMLQHVSIAWAIAFEMNPTIFAMTRANLDRLEMAMPIDLRCGDYRSLLLACSIPSDHLLVVYVSPPWEDAFNERSGFDLRRTQPPIPEIISTIERVYHDMPILYVTQVRQPLNTASLMEIKRQFEWSQLRIYDISAEGVKPGILLGSCRWRPNVDIK